MYDQKYSTKKAARNVRLQQYLQVDGYLRQGLQGLFQGRGELIHVDIREIMLIFKTVIHFIVLHFFLDV